MKVSRYMVLSDRTFADESGRRFRVGYLTSRARTYLLDEVTATALSRGCIDSINSGDQLRLQELGIIVPKESNEYDEVIYRSKSAVASHESRAFVVMPTSYCNMGCEYCGQSHEKASAGRLKSRIVERVRRAAAMPGTKSLHIGWFGGEPLMAYATLRSLSQSFTEIADGYGCTYSSNLVTNGSLLSVKKLQELYCECRVGSVEITIDGPREYHNSSRKLKGKWSNSFDRIIETLSVAVDQPDLEGLEITIRTNVGMANAGMADEFCRSMVDAGLADQRMIRFYPAVIHSWGNDISDIGIDKSSFSRMEMEWLQAYADAGLQHSLLPTRPQPVVCMAVYDGSEVIDARGNVFSCTEQPLVPGYESTSLGTLDSLAEDLKRPSGEYDDWHASLTAGTETPCSRCTILPICGGSCPKLWREGEYPCPSLKFNLKDRLSLYAEHSGLTPA